MRARPPALPWPRRPAARALAGARAVRVVRRSLARYTAQALRLLRFGRWLRALTGQPPSLAEEQPLGILPALVAGGAAPAGDGAKPPTAGHPEAPTRAARARRRAGAQAGRRRGRPGTAALGPSAGAVPMRAAMADGGLAAPGSHAAADLPRASTIVRTPPPAPGPAARRGHARRAGPSGAHGRVRALAALAPRRRRARRVPGSAGSGASAPTATLTDVLAARAERRLAVAAEAAATSGADGPPAALPAQSRGSRHPDSPQAGAEVVRAALARQWAARITGRSAPADLLGRLAGEDATGRPAGPSGRADPQDAAGAAGGDPAVARGAPRRHVPASREGDSAPAPRLPARAAGPLLEPAGPGAPPAPVRGLAVDTPAQGLGAPAEAAERLRLPAAFDAATGEELDVLAANVKRILDHEARRHGIDV